MTAIVFNLLCLSSFGRGPGVIKKFNVYMERDTVIVSTSTFLTVSPYSKKCNIYEQSYAIQLSLNAAGSHCETYFKNCIVKRAKTLKNGYLGWIDGDYFGNGCITKVELSASKM
jgi:hypothetical protein